MKFFLVLFLAGFGLAAATNVLPNNFENDVQLHDEQEDLFETVLGAEDDPKTELSRILKKHFEEILEKVKDIIENGKTYKEDLGDKLKEIAQKLKDMKVDIGDHAKELLKNLKDKAKDYWKRVLDRITPGSDTLILYEDPKTELGRILKKHFEEILEKVNDIIENGKAYKEDLGEKLKEIAQKLRDMKVDIGDHARDLLKNLKDKAKDYWKKVLDKITPGSDTIVLLALDSDVKHDLGKKLRENFDRIVEVLKDIFETGKPYRQELIEKMKDIWQKLQNIGHDISEEQKEDLQKLTEKALDYFKKIWEKVDKKVSFSEEEDLARNLRERFEEILEKIKDAIENRKLVGGNVVSKLREIFNQMKEKSIPFGDKAKELLEQLKEKATGIWKRILDKINISKRSLEARGTGAENLRERLEELLEKLKEAFRERKLPGKGFIAKLRQIRDEMRQKNVPLGGKLREMIEKLKENANGIWRRILDRLGQHAPSRADEGEDFARNLRERFEEILEKIKDAIENRKLVGGNVVAKLREIFNQMKEKSIPFGDKAKELLEQLKEKATGIWKRILDKINISKRSQEARGTGAENLRERLEELLEKLKEAFRDRKLPGKGFIAKLRQIRDEMRQKNVPLGGKLKEMIEKLKENANGIWKRILDRIGQHTPSRVEEDQYAKNLRDRLNEILDIVKDGFVTRTTIGGQYLYHLETVWNELKEKSISPGDRAIELIQELKKMTNGEWKRLLFKLLPDEE